MSRITNIADCIKVKLPKVENTMGNLTAITGDESVPFPIKRVYYLYDVPGGEERGGHAHRGLFQLIVAASGSFDVELFDGREKKTVSLNRPYDALLMKPGIWRELKNFSSGSICLVLASSLYDEGDYIRDLEEFINYKDA